MAERTLGPVEEPRIAQSIVFRLADEEFGVSIGAVREIIRAGSVTQIPDSPSFIKGVINVRGEIVAAIDLKARFFLGPEPASQSKHIIITQQEDTLFGLMVDEVTEVLRVPEAEIKHPPHLMTELDEEYVSGVITLDGRLVLLLDLAKVLSGEEMARLNEVRRRQRSEPEPMPRRAKDQPTETDMRAAVRKAQQSGNSVAEDNKGREQIAEREAEEGPSPSLSRVARKRRRGRK